MHRSRADKGYPPWHKLAQNVFPPWKTNIDVTYSPVYNAAISDTFREVFGNARILIFYLSIKAWEEKSLPKSHLGWFFLMFGEGKATKENISFFWFIWPLINDFQQEKGHSYQVNYIKEISNDGIVLLADARNVTLRTHRVNGALVEVSCNPFTEDSESQSNQVSHWDGISCESSSDFIIAPNDPKGSVLRV